MQKSKTTTISAELRRMEEVTKLKVENFKPARNCNLADQIFHLFKSSSKAHFDTDEIAKIYKVIEYSLETNTPIKISFLWALYWMVQSPWKFIDWNIIKPRLGDHWAPHWLSMINRKLKKFFPSGCKFYIINEQAMVKEMGWTKEQAEERRLILEPIYSQFDCVKIVDIPDFPEQSDITLNNEEIIATIISTPSLFNLIPKESMRIIMDEFYVDRNKICEEFSAYGVKNIDKIMKIIPSDIWKKGAEIKKRMNQIAMGRRTGGWLDKEVMNGEPFIDAAIINRGRWSPNIWAFTSPQHGGSILDLNNKLYSISIAPEYRLKESGGYQPVMIKEGDQEYIFYWEKI